MTTVALFHSALGLRPAIGTFAEHLRARGHAVHTPDLYDGEVFEDLDAGIAKRDAVGIDELFARAQRAVADLPADTVYAGFSMGAAAAQAMALSQPGAHGAILIDGAVPLSAIGLSTWPADVAVQLHAVTDDPWFPRAEIDEFLDGVPDDVREVHLYDGRGHLVFDDAWPDHDPDVAERLRDNVVDWLSRR